MEDGDLFPEQQEIKFGQITGEKGKKKNEMLFTRLNILMFNGNMAFDWYLI